MNCEWLLRPHMASSEFAEAIVDNSATIADSNLFSEALQPLTVATNSLMDTLRNLNTRDQTTTLTANDIHNLLTFALTD